VATALSLLLLAPAARAAAPPELRTLAAADSLLRTPPSAARERALKTWCARHATLADLIYVLRRPAHELAASEAPLIESALQRAPADRAALRRRLHARLASVSPERSAKLRVKSAGSPVLHPRASVFRVAALLPDSGDYQGFGAAVMEGLKAGLADSAAGSPARLEIVHGSTGQDDPARTLWAFDVSSSGAGSAVGELLSVPTLVAAAAARYAEIPLISPTATDEEIGRMGSGIFQIGPSAYQRGRRLARAALGGAALRVGVLVSSSARGALTRGFVSAARAAGANVVWEDHYPDGNLNFRDKVKALTANQVQILFWDGEAREAEALVRQLARDRVSLKLCGSAGLSPASHHAETKILLEGVQYVGDEWEPGPTLRAHLDRVITEESDEREAGLALRGYVSGRLLAAAVGSGALCPEEIAAWLAARTESEPYLKARGFLDLSGQDVTIPVYTAQRGEGVAQ
jgi:ABC-type branched-subunit amino acid transport system substrate-binding protein